MKNEKQLCAPGRSPWRQPTNGTGGSRPAHWDKIVPHRMGVPWDGQSSLSKGIWSYDIGRACLCNGCFELDFRLTLQQGWGVSLSLNQALLVGGVGKKEGSRQCLFSLPQLLCCSPWAAGLCVLSGLTLPNLWWLSEYWQSSPWRTCMCSVTSSNSTLSLCPGQSTPECLAPEGPHPELYGNSHILDFSK